MTEYPDLHWESLNALRRHLYKRMTAPLAEVMAYLDAAQKDSSAAPTPSESQSQARSRLDALMNLIEAWSTLIDWKASNKIKEVDYSLIKPAELPSWLVDYMSERAVVKMEQKLLLHVHAATFYEGILMLINVADAVGDLSHIMLNDATAPREGVWLRVVFVPPKGNAYQSKLAILDGMDKDDPARHDIALQFAAVSDIFELNQTRFSLQNNTRTGHQAFAVLVPAEAGDEAADQDTEAGETESGPQQETGRARVQATSTASQSTAEAQTASEATDSASSEAGASGPTVATPKDKMLSVSKATAQGPAAESSPPSVEGTARPAATEPPPKAKLTQNDSPAQADTSQADLSLLLSPAASPPKDTIVLSPEQAEAMMQKLIGLLEPEVDRLHLNADPSTRSNSQVVEHVLATIYGVIQAEAASPKDTPASRLAVIRKIIDIETEALQLGDVRQKAHQALDSTVSTSERARVVLAKVCVMLDEEPAVASTEQGPYDDSETQPVTVVETGDMGKSHADRLSELREVPKTVIPESIDASLDGDVTQPIMAGPWESREDSGASRLAGNNALPSGSLFDK
ncbi:MAG: hypothetical protein GYB66_00645 [Chloroflexi bacterium]|nr:hypothetical protein [Chloroflexota bacterium]